MYVRLYGDDLEEAYASFLYSAYGAMARYKYPDRLRWFRSNPHGGDVTVAVDGDRVVGHYGVMGVQLRVGEVVCPAVFGVDLFVAPETRGRGTASMMFQEIERRFPIVLGFWQTRGGHDFRRRVGGHVVPNPLEFICENIDAVARFSSDIKVQRFVGPLSTELDDVWRAARRAFEIGVERTSQYLEWKYRSVPFTPAEVALALREGRPVGYVVFRRGVDPEPPIVSVLELVFNPSCPEAHHALLAHVSSFALESGCRELRIVASLPSHERLALERGFVPLRRMVCPPLVSHRADVAPLITRTLHSSTQWFWGRGDGDFDQYPLIHSR